MGRRSTKGRPCPVCGDTKARCKVEDDGDRLLCRGVLDKHSPLLGETWRWAGAVNGGPGGSVLVRRVEDDLTPERARAKRTRARKQRESAPEVSDTASADTEAFLAFQQERSRKFKALVSGRTLDDDAKAALVLRGIPARDLGALEDLGFVSITEGDVCLAAAGAPGVDDRGNYIGPTGFLIPAYRPKPGGGIEYLGMQIATCSEYRDAEGGKYVWLSMGTDDEKRKEFALKVVTEDGSLDTAPLFQHSAGDRVEVAFLCDGALKAYVTALRQQQAAFGAPGAMFSTSMGQLRDGLRRVVGLNSRVRIAVAPDAADPGNRLIMEQLGSVAMAVRDMGYQIDWVDLQQELGKGVGKDIDETDVAVEDLIAQEEFFQKMSPGVRREVRKGLARRWERGFRPMKPKDRLEPQLSSENPILYRKGQRTEKLSELIAAGHRCIVDTSPTGAGKSHWWAHLERADLEKLGVDQVVVLSERYLEQAEEFDVGMVRGRQANGVKRTDEGRLFTVKHEEQLGAGETLALASNCVQGKELAKFQERYMQSSLSSLCTECCYRETCESTPGAYRYDRAEALLEPVVVMHPQSMQEQFVLQQQDESEGGLTISRTGVVLDDVALEQLLQTVVVNQASVLHSLSPIIDVLQQVEGFRALEQVVSCNKAFNSQELRAACHHALKVGMPRYGWAALIEQEEEEVGKADSRLGRRCWLSYLQDWVNGNAVAYTDGSGNLVFKCVQTRLRDALANAAWVLILDATASPLVLSRILGEMPEMIAEERWLTPADLRIQQVKGLGPLGYRRTEQQNFQVKVALGKLKKAGLLPYDSTAVIDTKAGLEISKPFGIVTMAYLSDSRGSNRAYDAKCSTLVLIGAPNTNLGNAAATYELLFGEAVDIEARRPVVYPVLQEDGDAPMVCCEVGSQHEGFSRFYAHLRRAELLQALGRLRHNIRPGEVLDVFVLGDGLMPFPVRLVELSDVIDDDNMADWHACNDKTLGAAAWNLKGNDKPVTVEGIAQVTGLHPTLVGEWIRTFQPSWMHESKAKSSTRTPRAARHRRPRTTRQKTSPRRNVAA